MAKAESHYGLAHLQKIATAKTAELAKITGEQLKLNWPSDVTFNDWEIEYFLAAFHKYHLFDLAPRKGKPSDKWPNGCPRVDFAGKRMPVKANGEPYVHEFLTAWKSPIVTLGPAEYVTQAAAAGELVHRYGVPAENIRFELPLIADRSAGIRSGAYAMDLAVFDSKAKPWIAAEVKRSATAHDSLVRRINECRGFGVTKSLCPAGQDYRKCLWIRQNRTVRYLWVRSQEKSDLFKVKRSSDGSFDLSGALSESERDRILSNRKYH